MRGLFSGGTLAYETLLILQAYVPGVYSNVPLDEKLRLPDAFRTDEPAERPPAQGPGPAAPPGESREERVRALWRRACEGDPEAAYEGYRKLARHARGDEELCVRLYWLARLVPELDSDRCAWLVEALRQNGLSGRAGELYAREIDGDAAEAGGPRCKALLESPAPAPRLLELATRRWAGADPHERVRLVSGDLVTLRDRLEREDHTCWVRLLLRAADWLAWEKWRLGPKMLQACRREAEQAGATQFDLEAEFARSDFLVDLEQVCRRMRLSAAVPESFLHLVQDCWIRPYDRVRPKLLAYLQPLVERPVRGLAELDRVARFGTAPLHVLDTAIDKLYWERAGDRPQIARPVLIEDVREFLTQHHGEYLRPALLDLCTATGIVVQDFGELVLAELPHRHEWVDVARRALSDISLQCLVKACCALWA